MMINNSLMSRTSNMSYAFCNNTATALFTAVMTNNANVLSLAIFTPVTVLNNGKITTRISALFNQVRSKVRTESRLFKLVSSLVSTKNILLNSVSKCEVSNKVSTEKNVYNQVYHEKKILSLVSNEDFLGVTTRVREIENLYQSSKSFTKMAKMNNEFSDTLGTPNIIVFRVHKKGNYLSELFSFSRQVAITQAEKLLFSFFACCSICSMSSWGKRIFFNCDLLFLLAVAIIQSLILEMLRLTNNNKKRLTCLHTGLYVSIYTPKDYFRLHKTIAQRVRTSMSYLTQPLTEVMIMAERYDSAPLRAEQSKLFTFYNVLTSQLVRTIATTDKQARHNLSNSKLAFISRKPLAMGVNHG